MVPGPKGFGAQWAGKHPAPWALRDQKKGQLAAPAVTESVKGDYPEKVSGTGGLLPSASGMLDCVNFAESDWDKVMTIIKILYGCDVRGERIEVTSPRVLALRLKSIDDEIHIPGAHPRYFVEIRGPPYIDITEISSEFQASLVDNAFSAGDVELMAGGGAPMMSASVFPGIRVRVLEGSGTHEDYEKKEYRGTYNFFPNKTLP